MDRVALLKTSRLYKPSAAITMMCKRHRVPGMNAKTILVTRRLALLEVKHLAYHTIDFTSPSTHCGRSESIAGEQAQQPSFNLAKNLAKLRGFMPKVEG